MELIGPSTFVGILIFLLIGFGGLLLLLPLGKQDVKFLLSAFFIVLGLLVFDVYAQVIGLYFSYPRAAFWLNSLATLLGPLLFLVTRQTLFKDARIGLKDGWHLLPYFIYTGFAVGIYHFLSHDEKLEYLQNEIGQGQGENLIFGLLLLFGLVAYVIVSLRMVKKYRIRLREEYASVEQKNANWLGRLLYGFLVILSFSITIQIANYLPVGVEIARFLMVGLLLVMLLIILRSVYQGVIESNLFEGLSLETDEAESKGEKNASHDHELVAKLEQLLTGQRPYLDPEIDLSSLAGLLNVSPRELSQVINRDLGRSFFDLINQRRVEYVKQRLSSSDDSGLTVLEVMYDSGFNSKSSFNTAFRKHAGQTPTEFRRSLKS